MEIIKFKIKIELIIEYLKNKYEPYKLNEEKLKNRIKILINSKLLIFITFEV